MHVCYAWVLGAFVWVCVFISWVGICTNLLASLILTNEQANESCGEVQRCISYTPPLLPLLPLLPLPSSLPLLLPFPSSPQPRSLPALISSVRSMALRSGSFSSSRRMSSSPSHPPPVTRECRKGFSLHRPSSELHK